MTGILARVLLPATPLALAICAATTFSVGPPGLHHETYCVRGYSRREFQRRDRIPREALQNVHLVVRPRDRQKRPRRMPSHHPYPETWVWFGAKCPNHVSRERHDVELVLYRRVGEPLLPRTHDV